MLLSSSIGQQLPTLRKLLTENHIPEFRGLPANLLDTPINSYAMDGDERESVAAFFDLEGRLHAAVLNRAMNRWEYAIVNIDDGEGVGNSLVRLNRDKQYIYLESHINPSASRLLVLSRDLKLRRALSGWQLAMLPDETVVYHHNQVHFAATHSLEMSALNAATLQEKQIYPPKPYQPIRRSFIDRVAQEYKKRGDEWFRINNHHMNPELFDSSLVGDVTINASSATMSFLVQFGDPDNGKDPLTFTERVGVTCGPINQIQRLQCREEAAR